MNRRKLIFTSGIANSFEWYDYALFGHFAPIIGQKFFPSSDPATSFLQALLVFAIGYLMRPVGGVIFGIIGDKFGRKVALSSAIICMAFPTAAIGILPTYESIGISATIMMITVRMLQGLSMGGALTGSISFVIEHTEKHNRGFISSFSMASLCLGVLLGSLVSYITKYSFTPEEFDSFAWRLPFLIGIAVFFTGVYIKQKTTETPLFLDGKSHGDMVANPLKTAFRNHWFDMIVSILINATGSVIFYIQAIYFVTYLKTNRNFEPSEVDVLANLCYVIMIFATLIAGWLSDKAGRKIVFVFYLLAIIISTPILVQTFEHGSFSAVIAAQIILAILAAFYIGSEPVLQAELYPTQVRNTALSISYNIGTSVFGGTAPYIMETLVQNGNLNASVYYIITCSILSLLALYFYVDRS